MIQAYCLREGRLARYDVTADAPLPDDAIWIDLARPTTDEERLVETALSLSVPTHEEMAEIEPSSRLRIEEGVRYLTASLVFGINTDRPYLADLSFILAQRRLVTVRYDDSKALTAVAAGFERACPANLDGDQMMVSILDTVIDRSADLIEHMAADIDAISRRIFEREPARDSQRYRVLLRQIGRKGDVASKARESLVSLARIVTFLLAETDGRHLGKDQRATLKNMQRDIASLSDHVSFLGDKIIFLLDATLGMVSIEQNNIIKIFAVLSVVFMPPTLIASIYGMNFQYMPELADRWGYPIALVAMLAAAIGPYWFFKWKRWL